MVTFSNMTSFILEFYALIFLAYVFYSIVKVAKGEEKIKVPLRDLEPVFPMRAARPRTLRSVSPHGLPVRSTTQSPARRSSSRSSTQSPARRSTHSPARTTRHRSGSTSTRASSSSPSRPGSSSGMHNASASSSRRPSVSIWPRKSKSTPMAPDAVEGGEKRKSRPASLRSLAETKYRGMQFHGLPSPSFTSGFHVAAGQMAAR